MPYSEKLFFISEGKIEVFTDKQKLKEFIFNRPPYKKW